MFKSLTKSVSRSPKQELARLQADYDRGRTKEAIDELRALAADRPKSAALRVKLAGWLAKAGRRDEAISELFKLQEALSLQGNVLAAISAGLRIVQLDPKFDNPLSYLAKVNAERMKDETTTSSESAAAESGGEQHKSLSEIPFLADLTPEELQGVALGMKQRLLYDGAVVFEHGDASRSLCFVVSGTLEISNEKKAIDTAYPGECLGEFAFLTGAPRSAAVISLGESEVLELSFEAMEEVVRNHPRVRSVLDRMYQGRVLARVLAESPLFEFMSAGERHRVASRFEHMKVPRGVRVVEEGANDGALFLVKQGSLEIFTKSGERIGKVGPNEFFGEVSFLTGVPRTANITTTQDSELLRIERDELNEFAAEYPELLQVMKECRHERMEEAMQRAKARG